MTENLCPVFYVLIVDCHTTEVTNKQRKMLQNIYWRFESSKYACIQPEVKLMLIVIFVDLVISGAWSRFLFNG